MNPCLLLLCLWLASVAYATSPSLPEGWTSLAPRDEIKPRFEYDANGGPDHQGSLIIESGDREGLLGRWTKTIPVKGGQHYRFAVLRKVTGTTAPRRVGVARVLWRDDDGRPVKRDDPVVFARKHGAIATAEPEYPMDRKADAQGWTELSDVYHVPSAATQAVIELEFRWAPHARVEWAGCSLAEVSGPQPRMVRLATVHFVPRDAKTPVERRQAFQPMIEDAARQRADLVVLPEMLTYGGGAKYVEVAEPIPGPSTEYFGALAKKHNLYLVPGLVEREGPLVYNVALLIDPAGKIAGKYRKVCLPRSEIEGGITPGHDYPVFDTRFGKVGMMVCYDGFFPEVARELTNRGAEVIAWPVMGCNPLLAAARACENLVYLVSSTHSDASREWMISAIFGHDGRPLAQAREWGTIAIAEVDLNRPPQWPGLGNMRGEMPRHRPVDFAGQ